MLPLVIRVKRANGQTQVFAYAESPVRIGRSPLNHLHLDEQYISRFEAVVRFDAKEISYFNVGHTNATLLDGKPIGADTEVLLDERSQLLIGKLELRVSREAVDEAKIIRSSPKPADSAPETLEKTMFRTVDTPPPEPPPQPERQRSTPARAPVSPLPPAVVHARVVGVSASATDPSPRAAPRPAPTPTPTPAPRASAAAAAPATSETLVFSHAEYRRAWQSLLRDIEAKLQATPESERAAVAEQLQRDFPQIVRENDFRELLGRLGLKPRKPGDPELERWLRSLGKGLFPPGVRLETGMTIDRLGGLLQAFSQVFVEIQAAQNDARREMALPPGSSKSLLVSEDPNVILAYLLNPSVDGEQRLAELRQCVTTLAIHEAALFNAIKDAAQALLEALSPEAIAREEAQSSGEDQGMLSRVFGSKQDAADARLFRRYAAMHADLMDGKRFQRRFIGREFARIYLRAMEKLGSD